MVTISVLAVTMFSILCACEAQVIKIDSFSNQLKVSKNKHKDNNRVSNRKHVKLFLP